MQLFFVVVITQIGMDPVDMDPVELDSFQTLSSANQSPDSPRAIFCIFPALHCLSCSPVECKCSRVA